MGWWCDGVRWGDGGPLLRWRRRDGAGPAGDVRRESALRFGRDLGFRVCGGRVCGGARGNVCPVGAEIAGRSTGGLCPECARLDRLHSVAADGIADDPRVYCVYLAWFGPGMVKVGITREERGDARLLEQGAVVFSRLARGPLMAARRVEELLRVGLGIPDRISYAEKRLARAMPDERAGELRSLHARASALEGWPESLELLGFAAVDHGAAFGLDGLPPATGVVRELADGGYVAGTLVAAAGPDLHLATDDGGLVVLDTRLMRGWELAPVGEGGGAGRGVTVPVTDVRVGGVQSGLF